MSIKLENKQLIFVCDRCENTVEFYHGMPTFSLTYEDIQTYEKIQTEDKRTFCSEICARTIYLTEKGNK